MKRDIYGAVIGLSGLLLVGFNTGWLVALGIFLMLFGNNLQYGTKEGRSNG
jgi:hypothetical protein